MLAGKENMRNMIRMMGEDYKWVFNKVAKATTFYKRANYQEDCPDQTCTSYKFQIEFDQPAELLESYFFNSSQLMRYDEEYDWINEVRSLPLGTRLIHAQIKPQWPLGPRDTVILYHKYVNKDTGVIYSAAASFFHPEIPPDPSAKITRMRNYH
jgi:hypothetical protein